MIWSRCHHRPIHWVEIVLLAVILFLVMLVVRGCDSARAEWVVIDKFGGVNTDAGNTQMPMGDARYAVGVYLRNGALLNGDYARPAGQTYVSKEPCRVLGDLPGSNGVVFDNGWLQWYDAAGDSSYLLEDTTTTVSDSATGVRVAGDAGWSGAPGDLLVQALDTALAKFALSQLSSLRLKPIWGAAELVRPISCFYSEKYIRLADTGAILADSTYYWKTFGTVIGANNVSSLSTADTAWFFNGTQVTVLTSNDITKTVPHLLPGPPSTGTINYVSSTGIDTVYGQLRLKATAPIFKRSDIGKFMYFQDTSIVYTGQIARIYQFDTSSTAVFLRVMADSALRNRLLARYATSSLRVQIFNKGGNTGIGAYNWSLSDASLDSVSNYIIQCSTSVVYGISEYSALRYQNVTAENMFGPVYGPKLLANPRSGDNAFWEWQTKRVYRQADTIAYYPVKVRVIPIRKVGGSSTRIRVLLIQDSLMTGSISTGLATNTCTSGPVYRWGAGFPTTWATTGMFSKTWHWTIPEGHRARAFYSGNRLTTPWDSTVIFAWSYLDDYDSIQGMERLEGDAPIIGLSSMGSNLIVYRQRPPNAILTLSGFSAADFFLTPLSTDVGAVSDQSIARNPLDAADYFPNNSGMWKCDGSSVTKVETNCDAIFRDSINWAAETQICGVVYDDHYWLAAPFGTSTVNDRLMAIDLTSGAVTFVPNFDGWIPGSMKVLRIPGFQDRLYAGASDTGSFFRIAPPGTFPFAEDVTDAWQLTANAGEWRSGWMDFGDPGQRKRISNYSITYQGKAWISYGGQNDSIIVNLYKDFSDTPVWSDRIGAGGQNFNVVSRTMPVAGVVQGHHLSFGLQFKGPISGRGGDLLVSRVALNVMPAGAVKPR